MANAALAAATNNDTSLLDIFNRYRKEVNVNDIIKLEQSEQQLQDAERLRVQAIQLLTQLKDIDNWKVSRAKEDKTTNQKDFTEKENKPVTQNEELKKSLGDEKENKPVTQNEELKKSLGEMKSILLARLDEVENRIQELNELKKKKIEFLLSRR